MDPASSSYGPAKRGRGTAARSDPMSTDTVMNADADASGIEFSPMEVEKKYPVETIDMEDSDDENDSKEKKPLFKPLNPVEADPKLRKQMRRIPVPAHRMTPLKNNWTSILSPLVEHMKLQVRMNTKKRAIEIRMSKHTEDVGSLQKASDFCKAFMMGFEVQDAIALLRLDDLFIDSFEVKDVKRLQGDHLSRCIGRIAGKGGQTKYAIENSTRTRVVVADSHIHILGSFTNIKLARDAICSLILGSPPSKVYTHLRTVTKRVQERL